MEARHDWETRYNSYPQRRVMNWHVRKFYRWQHWLAVQQNRQFAQLHWATQYNLEFGVNENEWIKFLNLSHSFLLYGL